MEVGVSSCICYVRTLEGLEFIVCLCVNASFSIVLHNLCNKPLRCICILYADDEQIRR